MTRIDSTQIKWQVQVRRSRKHKWMAKGTFETRAAARERAKTYRDCFTTETWSGKEYEPFDFGNTRVIRHVAAVKGKK